MPHAGGPEPECKGHFLGPRRRTRQAPWEGPTSRVGRPEGVEVMTALDEWALTSSSTALSPRAPMLTTWTRPGDGQVAADSGPRGRRAKLLGRSAECGVFDRLIGAVRAGEGQ